MQQNIPAEQTITKPEAETKTDAAGQPIAGLSNAVLNRLMEEVKNEGRDSLLAYNRTHNRHNRGR